MSQYVNADHVALIYHEKKDVHLLVFLVSIFIKCLFLDEAKRLGRCLFLPFFGGSPTSSYLLFSTYNE